MVETAWTWATPWWWTLVIINRFNVIICLVLFVKSAKIKDVLNEKYLKYMRLFGLLYCLVALYRSIFVSRYLTQLAWFGGIGDFWGDVRRSFCIRRTIRAHLGAM